MEAENTPTSLEEWYTKAIKFDNQYRRTQKLIASRRSPGSGGNSRKPPTTRTWTINCPAHDLNAMDIDALTIDERMALMKKGVCFNCKAVGHMAKDCPKKERKPFNYE